MSFSRSGVRRFLAASMLVKNTPSLLGAGLPDRSASKVRSKSSRTSFTLFTRISNVFTRDLLPSPALRRLQGPPATAPHRGTRKGVLFPRCAADDPRLSERRSDRQGHI